MKLIDDERVYERVYKRGNAETKRANPIAISKIHTTQHNCNLEYHKEKSVR